MVMGFWAGRNKKEADKYTGAALAADNAMVTELGGEITGFAIKALGGRL
jgi:hypothetical protein